VRQRVGVVLAARAARERQQLGHHGQQQRELVGRPRQVHKHAALEQRLAGLRARAPSSAAAQRAGCSPSLCHLQRTAHRSGMHLRVPLHTIASDNGLLGRLRMAGGCSGARAGGAPAGRRAAAAGRARHESGGRGAPGTARACAALWRPPRAAVAPRAPPRTRRRPLRARAHALAPRAAAPCRTPFIHFTHCAASTFQGTGAYLALRTGTISTAACPRNVWSPAGRRSLGARTRVLRRGRDQVAEQLAVGCLHEALEQHADRDEELRAPDGEREVDRAVCQVVAAHGRGRLVRPHAPARARAAGSPGCARRQRSLQKPSMYQKLQPCTITTTSVHFP